MLIIAWEKQSTLGQRVSGHLHTPLRTLGNCKMDNRTLQKLAWCITGICTIFLSTWNIFDMFATCIYGLASRYPGVRNAYNT